MSKPRLISILVSFGIVALFVMRNPLRSSPATDAAETAQSPADGTPSANLLKERSAPGAARIRPGTTMAVAAPPHPSATGPLVADPAPNTARADPLRAPVIEAIRSNELRGEAKRKAMLEAIRSSGESDEEWTAESEEAFDSWTNAMPKELRGKITMSEPRCFAAGCVADVTFADAETHRAAARTFRSLAEQGAGHGGRVQTPAESQGSKLVASWIMLRPQDF